MSRLQNTIAIIGGGVTGLAAAFRAQTNFPHARILLFESSKRLGGVLHTETDGGYVIEHSADMFTTDPPSALELCRQLGMASELIQTKPIRDRAFVATNQTIHPVPHGLSLMLPNDLQAVMDSPLLDSQARQRFAAERNVPVAEKANDESLESFAVRRFGQTAFDNLIQPLVGGIYTADPKKLSMQATLARFLAMEQQHGSLIGAAESKQRNSVEVDASGARYGMFRAPRDGVGQFVDWLHAALTNVEIRVDCPLSSISKTHAGWSLEMNGHQQNVERLHVDGCVLAIPARISGQFLKSSDPVLGQLLSQIEAASSAVVVLGIDRSRLRSFDGFGIIVPSILKRQVIATSFSSNKFSNRAPAGKALVRCFIGGALQSELVELEDEQLIRIACDELKRTVGLNGVPELTRVVRWRQCMPQYHLGHLDLVVRIESLVSKHTGLEVAGNSYRGVGIPACIQSGFEAIDRLANQFPDG